MGFEKIVLNKVESVLGTTDTANFAYGSLFVECTENEARQVYHRLSKDMFGKVRISKSEKSPEYVFDFTA
jgi:hypothetical protein